MPTLKEPMMKRFAMGGVVTLAAALALGQLGQVAPVTAPKELPTGIVLVPKVEKPQGSRKLEEKDFAGYLMVYFKDGTHSAYFAISRDGYTFTDLNNGQPIFEGAVIAEQKGVRDPSISRG